jgi:cell wall-associated NlpC family hydrolase
MTRPEQFAAAALDCVDTPFQAHGRVPGKDGSLDCIGIVIYAARAVGIEVEDVPYVIGAGTDLWSVMTAIVPRYLVEGTWPPFEVGDVLLLRYLKCPYHAAVYVGGGRIVHALSGRGVGLMCVDHAITRKVVSVWRLP